jgi:hypothetical protein
VNSSSSNTINVVQERLWRSNLLGVFSTLQKAESFKKKFKEIYPNINILLPLTFGTLAARVNSEEKYEEKVGWIWNEFNFQ